MNQVTGFVGNRYTLGRTGRFKTFSSTARYVVPGSVLAWLLESLSEPYHGRKISHPVLCWCSRFRQEPELRTWHLFIRQKAGAVFPTEKAVMDSLFFRREERTDARQSGPEFRWNTCRSMTGQHSRNRNGEFVQPALPTIRPQGRTRSSCRRPEVRTAGTGKETVSRWSAQCWLPPYDSPREAE